MKKWLPLLLLIPLAVYLYTLAPDITAQGDGGELVSTAYFLGINHPPGYPLFTLSAHLFALLPWGTVAARVNLFSAVTHVAALLVFYLILRRVTASALPAMGATLVLAFSYTFWLYSLVAEVFPLNDLLSLLLIYLVLLYSERKLSARDWLALGLVLGLGLSNHQIIILVLPAVCYYFFPRLVSWREKQRVSNQLRSLLALGAGLLLGLSPYLYLLVRGYTASAPPVAWSYPRNFSDLWHFFIRADYGTFTPMVGFEPAAVPLAAKVAQVENYLGFVVDDFTRAGILLAGLGALAGLLRYRRFARAMLILFLSAVLFLTYANFPLTDSQTGLAVLERFYLLPNMAVAAFIGLAFAAIYRFVQGKPVLRLLPVPMLLFYLVVLFFAHYPGVSQKNNFLAADFGKNILLSAPKDALLFVQGDIPTFTVFYERYINGVRPDVILFTPNFIAPANDYRFLRQSRPDLVIPKEASIAAVLSLNFPRYPVTSFTPTQFALPGLVASPSGLVFVFYPQKELPALSQWQAENETVLAQLSLPGQQTVEASQTLSDNAILDYYAQQFGYFGDNCRFRDQPDCAIDYYRRGLVFEPTKLTLHYNLGRLLASGNRCSEAQEELQTVLRLNPEATFAMDSLANLAEDCFHDRPRATYYRRMEEKPGPPDLLEDL